MTTIVSETTHGYLAIPSNSPVPGAYLIIPKRHIIDDRDLPDDWQLHRRELMRYIPWIDDAAHNCVTNVGISAGQTVAHVHEWIIPRIHELPGSTAYHKGMATLVGEANERAEYLRDAAEYGLN